MEQEINAGMSRPGPDFGRKEQPALYAQEMNRGQRRRLDAQQRANERRQEKARDAVQGRISQGLDLLRYLMAQRVGIPVEHVGIIVEGGQARAYDVRGGSLLPAQEEAAAEAVDGEGLTNG